MSHSDGWVWTLTAKDGPGETVRLTQAWDRLKYRNLARLVKYRLRQQPARFHEFRTRHLLWVDAELYPWADLGDDCSERLPKSSPAATIKPSATAGWLMAPCRFIAHAGLTVVEKLLITLRWLIYGPRRNKSH